MILLETVILELQHYHHLFLDDNSSSKSSIEKIETPRPNGKTVRFQTEVEQPYTHQESINDDANGKIAKTVDSEENDSNQPNTNRYKFIIGTII